MADDKPIIIVKKKGGHAGHHGGAWKVAYADFVTAMMAFFMVMWLVNSATTNTKQSIASYFRTPGLFEMGSGTPLLMGEAGILSDSFTPPSHHREKGKEREPNKQPPVDLREKQDQFHPDVTDPGEQEMGDKEKLLMQKSQAAQVSELKEIAQEIHTELNKIPDIEQLIGELEVKLEGDGLNIEIMDTAKGSMFTAGSAAITPAAQSAFHRIAEIVAKYPNRIDLIGHTDAKPFSNRPNGYSNWELSSDRANAARRLLVNAGIKEDRLVSVIGRSDRDLRDKSNPFAPANRRITMKLRFTNERNVALKDLDSGLKQVQVQPVIQKKLTQSKKKTEKPAASTDPFAGKYHLPWVTHKRHNVPANPDSRDVIKLEDTPPNDTPAKEQPHRRDKIFSNNPVIGPVSPFSSP